MALEFLAVLRCRGVKCRGAPLWLIGSIPPPPTCFAGPLRVAVVCSGVGKSAGSNGGGLQDAPEGGLWNL